MNDDSSLSIRSFLYLGLWGSLLQTARSFQDLICEWQGIFSPFIKGILGRRMQDFHDLFSHKAQRAPHSFAILEHSPEDER